ncbi:MAG TPA: hypothetical protein VGQ99_23510 [Tepidisphaeraceae bacterium]|jgi:hypothetical protein|nr:hypothetical protein [Tepidisphaeraceae bacterium]HEV8608322.1 hypothetical protein [Tepidisphaeraceae bacterium]
MNANVESLWQELRKILHARGQLPFRHDVLTPGEIADTIGRGSGDSRVHRFVWEYYYPQRYGKAAGTMSDAEAQALIDSLRERAQPPRSTAEAASHAATCGICQRQSVSSASPGNKGPVA